MQWIEIILGFECNCRCRVCPSSAQIGTPPMSLGEIEHWLQDARRQGARNVWFGGGEPTLHPDLSKSLARAAGIGYQRIRIQTNGMRFAYRPYTMRCLASGATEVSVSIKGADKETHDSLTQNDRSFELLCRGVQNLAAEDVLVEADVLMTLGNLGQLSEVVTRFSRMGVSGFSFWLTSLHGMADPSLARLMPQLTQAVQQLKGAFQTADRLGVRATSWHTPPCVLPADCRDRYVHSGTLDLAVITPGSKPFRAQESPMEGGAYLESCAECSARPNCLGPRKDYLETYGSSEFNPL